MTEKPIKIGGCIIHPLDSLLPGFTENPSMVIVTGAVVPGVKAIAAPGSRIPADDAPAAEWQAFLANMLDGAKDNPLFDEFVARAEQVLRAREKSDEATPAEAHECASMMLIRQCSTRSSFLHSLCR